MSIENKINIDLFKVIKSAMHTSADLESMGNNLVQLMTGALDIKGCSLFAANPQKKELDIFTTFGLSTTYLRKGAISSKKSIAAIYNKKPVVIKDTSNTDLLQYPEAAQKEGIKSIISLPVVFSGKIIGAIRLYHNQSWDVSDHDLETLMLFTDHVGMAMTYTRLLNAFMLIKDTVQDVHDIWVDPC
ncbi:GAF domain-containing protein [Desulfobacula phenolica]|uniref:GAF domain-containing protein n=1 Tax=Desulfobacula phenolica TaxID=90732 RepID=A0A1H2JU64_9BACT|nr:GAF domain-containing protein [Desulfobacula phenolica]SDU59708.1 GAF domain-containing protein [Desulfobacula phenolica]